MKQNLKALITKNTELRVLAKQQRLLSYNSTIARYPRNPELTTIEVQYFSADATISILAKSGIRTIYSLGIDGGIGYSKKFDKKHHLINGRSSFDIQFTAIKKITKQYSINFIRLKSNVTN
jgi:hypothetical protein